MRKHLHLIVVFSAFLLVTYGVLRWQNALQQGKGFQLTQSERLDAASGICLEETRTFFYFYYYLNLLPLTSLVNPTVYSKQGAEEFVKEHGSSLANDFNRPCGIGRAGDWGKFLVLLPHAWATRTAANPSTIPTTAFLFKLSLIAILASSFILRRYALGLFLVLLVGSYRFQLFEAYFRNNLHSLAISSCLLLLALNLRFMSRSSSKERAWDFALAALSGLLLGLGAVIRGDSLPMLLSVLALYLLSGQRLKRSLTLCAVFLATLFSTTKSFEVYFDYKVREAHQFVINAGGTLRVGTTLKHHPIWHPIAAGLGDYGTDRGFVWDDLAIFKKALPIINEKYNRHLEFNRYYYTESGMAEHEWLRPEIMPEYVETVKEMVLSTIKQDPWWYAQILIKRFQRLSYTFSSARITWPSGDYPFPLSKWIFVPILIACVVSRRVDPLKMVAFSLPTCFVPLVITSAMGTANYTITHLVAAAVSLDALLFLLCALPQRVISNRSLQSASRTSEASAAMAPNLPQ